MADMRARSLGLAFAAILLLGRTVPGHAEDAASKSARTPAAAPAPAPAAAQTEAHPLDAYSLVQLVTGLAQIQLWKIISRW
jgi:hypothetical protein